MVSVYTGLSDNIAPPDLCFSSNPGFWDPGPSQTPPGGGLGGPPGPQKTRIWARTYARPRIFPKFRLQTSPLFFGKKKKGGGGEFNQALLRGPRTPKNRVFWGPGGLVSGGLREGVWAGRGGSGQVEARRGGLRRGEACRGEWHGVSVFFSNRVNLRFFDKL